MTTASALCGEVADLRPEVGDDASRVVAEEEMLGRNSAAHLGEILAASERLAIRDAGSFVAQPAAPAKKMMKRSLEAMKTTASISAKPLPAGTTKSATVKKLAAPRPVTSASVSLSESLNSVSVANKVFPKEETRTPPISSETNRASWQRTVPADEDSPGLTRRGRSAQPESVAVLDASGVNMHARNANRETSIDENEPAVAKPRPRVKDDTVVHACRPAGRRASGSVSSRDYNARRRTSSAAFERKPEKNKTGQAPLPRFIPRSTTSEPTPGRLKTPEEAGFTDSPSEGGKGGTEVDSSEGKIKTIHMPERSKADKADRVTKGELAR